MNFKSILIVLLFCPGCGVFIADHMMDKMVETMDKMEKIDARRRERLGKESYVVQGTVSGVSLREVEVPEQDIRFQVELGNYKKAEQSESPKLRIEKHWVVTFSDGREKEFNDIPSQPMYPGKYYIIRYNGLDVITEINEQ